VSQQTRRHDGAPGVSADKRTQWGISYPRSAVEIDQGRSTF
jgi:hypothetical protein